MNKPLKLIRIGNSAGVILPKDMMVKLGIAVGDSLDVAEVPGGMQLQRHDGGFAAQMEVARAVMTRRRNALRELAK